MSQKKMPVYTQTLMSLIWLCDRIFLRCSSLSSRYDTWSFFSKAFSTPANAALNVSCITRWEDTKHKRHCQQTVYYSKYNSIIIIIIIIIIFFITIVDKPQQSTCTISRSHGSVRVVRTTSKVNGKCWNLTPKR